MAKRRKLAHHNPRAAKAVKNKPNRAMSPSSKKSKPNSPRAPPKQQSTAPVIPFEPDDNILLVGEGDLSFAASLVEHHSCTKLTATVLEPSQAQLLEKYPHALGNIEKVTAAGSECKVLYGIDARTMRPFVTKKITETGGRESTGIFNRIIFNFPHVGGKSTDINRQVRYNQELIVAFFKSAQPSLAPSGSIVVTLFEGEPYTLWNIRDLGRHSGLQVERSFQFQAVVYPGYHHARTLGVVKNRKGEAGGGWKGEERSARSYVFVRKGEVSSLETSRKRRREEDDSSDED